MLFYSGKGEIKPLTIDPKARFEYYIDHIVNKFYLGCETPLPRLFSTPGFTEASAKAALELQEMLIKPVQRYIKRTVENAIFAQILAQAGFNPYEAKVRLNWGSPKKPEISVADMLKAADLGLITGEEFRKNAVKWGWELWEQPKPETIHGRRKHDAGFFSPLSPPKMCMAPFRMAGNPPSSMRKSSCGDERQWSTY